MEDYKLFLDEIYPNDGLKFFCLAGIAIKVDVYDNVIMTKVKKLKKLVFGKDNIIIHEQEIRAQKDAFAVLKNSKARHMFWEGIEEIFKENDFHVFAVAIHEEELTKLYKGHKRDKYFISLQVILENFTHFLASKNGKGYLEVESRDRAIDEQLQNHFYSLKILGTLFYEPNILQKHLGTIKFPSKSENVIGLQLADLIPNPLNRQLSSMKQKQPSILDVINQKAYDGDGISRIDRFGVKKIP